MSSGSTIMIAELVETLESKDINEAIKAYKERSMIYSSAEKTTPNIIDYKTDEDDDTRYYLEIKTGKVWKNIIYYDFSSSFEELKSYLYMNLDDVVKLEDTDLFMIKQAADYLLHGKYDHQLEVILNNPYIDVLGENYTPFRTKGKRYEEDKYLQITYMSLSECIGVYLHSDNYKQPERCVLYFSW